MTITNAVDQATAAHRNFHGLNHKFRVAEQLIEEMAELTVELCHLLRGREYNITEEMADVEICLTVLKDAMGFGWNPSTPREVKLESDYRSMMTDKALRLIDRLEAMRKGDRPTPERASS